MSRIFIENLPKNINHNELERRFAQKGEITDIQLRKDKRNAFVGFKCTEQAKDAVEYFNKTFINTSKISVKLADSFRLNKAKSKPSNNDSECPQKFDPFDEVKDDPKFDDFLKLQRNIDLSNKSKGIWKDDILMSTNDSIYPKIGEKSEGGDEEDIEKEENKIDKKSAKNTFEFTVKVKGLPYKIKKSQLKEFLKPIKPLSMRFIPHVKGIAYVSFKNRTDLNQAMIKHRGFIDGHRIEIIKIDSNKSKITKDNEDKSSETKDKWEHKELMMPEPISESGRIYVRNLCYTCTEDDLRQLFEKYGALTELHMPIDSYTKKPKGFAFITFMFPEHAIQAFNELDKSDFQGRLIHLLPAHSKSESHYNGPPPLLQHNEESNNNPSKKSIYKQTKLEDIKKDYNNSTRWNTLFIRPNAVADIMSKSLNINKLDLLTKSDRKSNVAVRMSLGEAQIVNDIKQFLIKNNVHLESFERGVDCPRSNTTILVKNLPAETHEDEVKHLFQKFGLVNQVILPPYGVTAIVNMQEPNEAKFAFKKLAYNNFKHYPLYLEWAPADVFIKHDNHHQSGAVNSDQDNKTKSNEMSHEIEDNSTIFVKNLNFETTEENFRKHFEQIGMVHSATIATKKTSKGILSMGYGFIQFYEAKFAKEAIKKLQHSTLDDHKIEIKLSNRMTQRDNMASKKIIGKNNVQTKQTGSKICVKNIPFEATIEDVKKIFSTYGQIKSIRIPRKLAESSQFRGFGFIDFVSKQDAKRAFDALSLSTHLYGRPLVLEWAKDESSSTATALNDDEIKHVGGKIARYFNSETTDVTNPKRLKKNDLVNDLKRQSPVTTKTTLATKNDD